MKKNAGRPKFLKLHQEQWLILNYPNYYNEELAEKLSEMINEENSQEAEKLSLLVKRFDGRKKSAITKRINFLKSQVFVTTRLIAGYAHRHNLKKSPEFRSRYKAQCAKAKSQKDLLRKAMLVEKPTKFLRTIEVRKRLYIIRLQSKKKMTSFNPLLSRWNKSEGVDKGIYVRARYDYDNCIITLRTSHSK